MEKDFDIFRKMGLPFDSNRLLWINKKCNEVSRKVLKDGGVVRLRTSELADVDSTEDYSAGNVLRADGAEFVPARLDTDDVDEATNLYFTEGRAQDAVGGIVANSETISLTYDEETPEITAELDETLKGNYDEAYSHSQVTSGNPHDVTAGDVLIEDEGEYFTGTTVEEALQELGAGGPGGSGITWKSAWADDTEYAVNDAVSGGGSSYLCISEHTSGSDTEPGIGVDWETVWDLMVMKGADGAPGEKGDKGDKGDTGDPGVVSAISPLSYDSGTKTVSIQDGTTSQKGAVQLSNSYTGDSESLAVTEKALSDGLDSVSVSGDITYEVLMEKTLTNWW